MNYVLENIKTNSVGNNKKSKMNITVKKISKTTIITMVAFVTSISMAACHSYNHPMAGRFRNSYVCEAESIYEQYNLDNQKLYSPDDYKMIKEIDEDNLLGFYELLGKDKSEQIVISLGYSNWEDFLKQHNANNITEWENSVLQKAIEEENKRGLQK